MRRYWLHGVMALCLSGTCGMAHADDWRPVRPPVTAASGSGVVQLGKPVSARSNENANPFAWTSLRTEASNDSQPRTVVRGQSPVGSEEQFNCGVVSEGVPPPPPPGAGPVGGFRGWWDGIWVGGPQQSFNTLVGGPVTYRCDRAFENFVSPVSNPFFFEDPRASTELRPIFMYQRMPGKTRTIADLPGLTPVSQFSGGNIEYFGLQGRLAFNERFSLVLHNLGGVAAQPNGLITVPAGSSPVFGDDVGFAQIQIGPKFTFYRDDVTNTVMAFGLNFEIPVGSSRLAQDTGSGAVTPYFSLGQQLGLNWHFLGTFGYRFSFDNERTNSFFTSLHLDYGFYNRVYPLVELNWYHYVTNGNARAANFEGQDLFNFGSSNVAGGDVLTLAAGVRFKITENIQAGIVYEFPLLQKDDLLGYRITADLIFRY